MSTQEQGRRLLDKATSYGVSIGEVLERNRKKGDLIPELTLDECKELALITKFSLAQICEAFKVEPPPPDWHY